MSRLHYYAALVLLVASGFSLAAHRRPRPVEGPVPVATAPSPTGAEGWFQSVKPYCNAVEAEVVLRNSPAPEGLEGQAFTAACLALSGRIEAARAILLGIPEADRYRAAGIVFDVAHPVADAGDDRSAGPIMSLVVEFWPNHYMALYHAGMADYALGDLDLARKYLNAFLENYSQNDGWRSNALTVLERLK